MKGLVIKRLQGVFYWRMSFGEASFEYYKVRIIFRLIFSNGALENKILILASLKIKYPP